MITARDLCEIVRASRGHAEARFGAEGVEAVDELCSKLESVGEVSIDKVLEKLGKAPAKRKPPGRPRKLQTLDQAVVEGFVQKLRAELDDPGATQETTAQLEKRTKPYVAAVAKALGIEVAGTKAQLIVMISARALQKERDSEVGERIRHGG